MWVIPAIGSGAADYLLEQSLLFNGTTTYLTRTPSTAGNRKTWTFSAWVKRGALGFMVPFSAVASSTTYTLINFTAGDGIQLFDYAASVVTTQKITSAVFRDPNAWYHIVVACDQTQATAEDRWKLYVNGTRITSFGTNTIGAQNTDTSVNNTLAHEIGDYTGTGSSNPFDGLMALPILVDGAALDPTSFGELDDDGYWNPIEFTSGTNTALSSEFGSAEQYLTNASSYTFTGKNIGTAASNRWVYVGASLDANTTTPQITAMTIGGVTAELVQAERHTAGTTYHIEVWRALVPTGTTADIAVTAASTWDRLDIGVQSVYGDQTLYSNAYSQTSGGSLTVNVPAGSTVLGFAYANGTAGQSATWTGGSIAEDYDQSAYYSHTGAREDVATEQGSVTYTASITGGGSRFGAIVLVLAPVEQDYGTNGFELDYADTAAFGADAKTNTNTMTPTYEAQYFNTSNLTTYTFSACDLGTADADRSIIVAVGAGRATAGSRTVSSLTIGGVSATFAGRKQTANLNAHEIWYAKVPTGATGDVVVTFNSSMEACGIGIWSVLNLGPVQDVQGDNTTGSVASQSVSIGGGESAFAVLSVYDQGSVSAVSWSTATERYEDLSNELGTYNLIGADYAFSSAANATTVTATYTGTGGNDGSLLGVTFGRPNDNFYKANNFTADDQLSDTPTDSADDEIGNFATFNPLTRQGAAHTMSNGNRTTQYTSTTRTLNALTQSVKSGKYFQAFSIAGGLGTDDVFIGYIRETDFSNLNDATGSNEQCTGQLVTGASNYEIRGNNTGTPKSTSDEIYVALDLDNNRAWLGMYDASAAVTQWWDHAGATWRTTDEPALGTNFTYSLSADILHTFCVALRDSNTVSIIDINDISGTAPTGFSALATQNLPAPTIADGSDYFNTVLYTGTGSTNSVTGVGFQPDFVWHKGRGPTAYSHGLWDSVRGANEWLASDSTGAETTTTQSLMSFDTDGFTVGTDTFINNTSDNTYVAWCWKAGGSPVSNTDGSITSSVSVNTAAGFSIVSYTGIRPTTGTVGHGLSQKPDMIIFKNRADATTWYVWHKDLTNQTTYVLFLDTTAAQSNVGTSTFNNTAPTSTVFSLGNDSNVNDTSDSHVAYCWHSVEGFSKFGSYIGNGSTNGPFVYTGFRPAFVMIKKSSGNGSWAIIDNKRNTYNPTSRRLLADATDAENTGLSDFCDMLSNGFKLRQSNNDSNASGGTYIYMAFAEVPFQGDEGYTQARAR